MTFWTDLTGIPYQVDFIDVDGVRTRVLRAGTGPPVLFLHGTSGHLEAFVRNLPAHATAFACHAIDLLGHGYTDPVDRPYRVVDYVAHVLGYLDAAGIDRAHLVGESLGGWVSARLASDHPDRVDRLTLVAPGGTVANPQVMERLKTTTRAAVEADDISLTRQRLELLMYDPATSVTDELVEVRHRVYHRPEFVAALPNLLCLQELEPRTADLLTEDQLARIGAPTLIIWGVQNPFGQVPEAERIHRLIPGSRLEIFDKCGHWPQHEHPDRFNTLNLSFLRGDG